MADGVFRPPFRLPAQASPLATLTSSVGGAAGVAALTLAAVLAAAAGRIGITGRLGVGPMGTVT